MQACYLSENLAARCAKKPIAGLLSVKLLQLRSNFACDHVMKKRQILRACFRLWDTGKMVELKQPLPSDTVATSLVYWTINAVAVDKV